MAKVKMELCSFGGELLDVPTYPECPYAEQPVGPFVHCNHPDKPYNFCSTCHMYPEKGNCQYV